VVSEVMATSVKTLMVLLIGVVSQLLGYSYAISSDDPADWLAKMVEARRTQTYQGIIVYSRGDKMSSMRVLHRYADGVEQERLIALDGEPREIIRRGDSVICIFPGNEQVQLEQAPPTGPFQAGIKDTFPLTSVYSIKVAGMERLAGHEVVKVAVMSRDQYRYSYLLWLEKNSGLMVKSALTGQDGEVLERFQFTSLNIGDPISNQQFTSDVVGEQIAHKSASVPPRKQKSPLAHHWQLDWLPEGFSSAPFVSKRNSVMPENTRTRVYSDGLAMFSVFVETQSDASMPEGKTKMGATTAYVKYVDYDSVRYVVTVVGEIPMVTAAKVASNLRIRSQHG
jgi:sigma-E factor negative regulatory protein RseB